MIFIILREIMVEVSRRTVEVIMRRGHLLGKLWKFNRWDMRWRVDEHSIMTAWETRASSRKWTLKGWLMHFHLPAHHVFFNLWTKQCLGLVSVSRLTRVLCVCSVVSDSLRPHGLGPTRLFCPWDSPGKNTGVGCHALLQGIFPTQNQTHICLNLLHCRQIL